MSDFTEQLENFRAGFAPNDGKKTIKIKGMIRASHRPVDVIKALELSSSPPIICAYIGTDGDPTKTFHAIHFQYDRSNVIHFMPQEANNMNNNVEFLVYENAKFVGIDDNGPYAKTFKEFNELKVINEDKATTSPQTASHRISIGVG